MPVTNNVTRMLDAKKIIYTAYELPAEKLGALETARQLGVSPAVIFKTIVALRAAPGSKPILAVIPGNSKLDLKALAAATNEKKVQVTTQLEAEGLTGLQAGGISPLGLLNRGFQVFLDRSAEAHDTIHISGGQRGLNIKLPVKDFLRLTNARLAQIATPTDEEQDD